ncbi:hypothetical protein HAX54_012147 [Datura stramonium]|uniref:Uncharacterized protein n=1 Tax=Datura stramonium TaxID=4076 RepID=A0ABS8RXL0_DATST|nr:hypothetical protein [Datura stramonium]
MSYVKPRSQSRPKSKLDVLSPPRLEPDSRLSLGFEFLSQGCSRGLISCRGQPWIEHGPRNLKQQDKGKCVLMTSCGDQSKSLFIGRKEELRYETTKSCPDDRKWLMKEYVSNVIMDYLHRGKGGFRVNSVELPMDLGILRQIQGLLVENGVLGLTNAMPERNLPKEPLLDKNQPQHQPAPLMKVNWCICYGLPEVENGLSRLTTFSQIQEFVMPESNVPETFDMGDKTLLEEEKNQKQHQPAPQEESVTLCETEESSLVSDLGEAMLDHATMKDRLDAIRASHATSLLDQQSWQSNAITRDAAMKNWYYLKIFS